MERSGYADLSNNAVELYQLAGHKLYDRVLLAALDYACAYATYFNIDRQSPTFYHTAKLHTEILVDEALYAFSQVTPEDHHNLVRLFEQKDLDYIIHFIEEDEKRDRKRISDKGQRKKN